MAPVIGSMVWLAGCAGAPQRFEFVERHMGTDVRIVAWASTAARAECGARAAFARIAALDATLSDWRPDSELSCLSRTAPGVAVAVSADLFRVLDRARELTIRTDGAFDVTVGPFVVLWRRAVRLGELPTPARLDTAATGVGPHVLRFDAARREVTLSESGVRIDLGGIGKGYAADAALLELERAGLPRALVDAGGDIAIGAAPPGREGWLIALGGIEEDSAATAGVLLANCGIATSGDLFRFVEIHGVRYSHIVDPRSGFGVPDRRAASVIARDAATADALASAACVLEPDAALRVVGAEPGAVALLRRAGPDGVRTYLSGGFPAITHRRSP